jgi:hypothetical protein
MFQRIFQVSENKERDRTVDGLGVTPIGNPATNIYQYSYTLDVFAGDVIRQPHLVGPHVALKNEASMRSSLDQER